jgi:hypothetical protein
METKFKTNDFYQSAILRAAGKELESLDNQAGKFVTFVFKDSNEDCTQIISDYWDKKLRLDARTLVETINELKTRVHDQMKLN